MSYRSFRPLATIRLEGLIELFLKSGLGAINGITCGHGIFVRPDAYSRHLITHELVHVLQYERFGGIEPYLKAYVPEIVSPPYYPNGPLEQEARRVADAVCADLS